MKRFLLTILCALASITLTSYTVASKPIPENTATMLGKALVNDAKSLFAGDLPGERLAVFVQGCQDRDERSAGVPLVAEELRFIGQRPLDPGQLRSETGKVAR